MSLAKSEYKTLKMMIVTCPSIILLFICFIVWQNYPLQKYTFFIAKSTTFNFKIDTIGGIFVCLIASLGWIATIYSVEFLHLSNIPRSKSFFSYLLLSILVTISLALANNLLTLFSAYELLTLSTYPLITHLATKTACDAGRKYITYLLTTSTLFLLPAIILTLNYHIVYNNLGNFYSQILLLTLYVFGLNKIALFPLHGWLVAAMAAPTPVSAFLHAVTVVKAGIFALIKIIIYNFNYEWARLASPEALIGYHWLTYLSSFTILFASIMAAKQYRLKPLLAYSTISQLAHCVLSLSIFTKLGIIATILHVIAHSFSKITLFFIAGYLGAVHKIDSIAECRGLAKAHPVIAICFAIGSFSLIGFPPLIGFWSKYYILKAAWVEHNWLVLGTLLMSSCLTTYYTLPVLYKFFWSRKSNFSKSDITPRALIFPMVFTAIVSLIGGMIFPYIINILMRDLP